MPLTSPTFVGIIFMTNKLNQSLLESNPYAGIDDIPFPKPSIYEQGGSIVITKVKMHFIITNAFGFSFLVSSLFIILNSILMKYFTDIWLKFGIFVTLGLSFIFMNVACAYHYTISILFFLISTVCSLVIYCFSYHHFCYSSSLLKFTLTLSFRSNISNNTSTSIFYTLSYVLIILFSLLYAYTALCTRLLHYHDLFYVYLLFSYWFSINTLCNVIYIITSYLSTGFYFTSNTPKPLQWPLSFAFKLSLVNNLGIAAKMALILPFVDFIKIGARTKPKLLQDFFFKINEKLASYLSKVSDLVITIFKKVSRFIDRKFTYPSRIGMIYSSMYGIKVEDGCTRYAKNSDKYYTNLLNETCTVGNNLGAICLIAAVTGGFAVYSICHHYVNSSNQAPMSFIISGATGFFFVFALVQGWRSMIRGMYEGILVGFTEMPFRMRNLDNNVANMLGNEYQKELDRRINCQPLGSPLTS